MIPAHTTARAEAASERAQASIDRAAFAAEIRAEEIALLAAEIVARRLRNPTLDDIIAGLHSATQAKDGRALKRAFLRGSDADLGALVRILITASIDEIAQLDAEDIFERQDQECAQ